MQPEAERAPLLAHLQEPLEGAQRLCKLPLLCAQARRVVGELGLDEATVTQMQKKSELERALDEAIREEAYESAARIRDELSALEGADVSPGQA